MLTIQRTTSDAAPGGLTDNEDMTDIAPREKTNHCERGRQFYELLARVSHWLRYRRQQQVPARVLACRKQWNIWARALLGLITSCATIMSSALAAPTFSGLPSMIPGGGVAGAVLSQGGGTDSGSHQFKGTATSQYVGMIAPDSSCSSIALGGGKLPDGCTRVINGVAYSLYFRSCPSVGFRPDTIRVQSGVNPSTLTIALPGGLASPNGTLNINNVATGTIVATGSWVLLDEPRNDTFSCTAYETTGTFNGLVSGDGIETYQGVSGVKRMYVLTSTDGGGVNAAPPPMVSPFCEFTTATPLAGNFGAQPLSTANIVNAGDERIIAIGTPNSFPINISCTGNMTGVRPKLHIDWTNSVQFKGSTRGMGVRNETPSDETNGVVLMSAQGSVGGTASCSGLPAGGEYCVDYDITPGTPLNLYPALFRNTSTTDKVQSGTHTVTGTINLVMP